MFYNENKFERASYLVAKGFELTILWHQPPKCLDYNCGDWFSLLSIILFKEPFYIKTSMSIKKKLHWKIWELIRAFLWGHTVLNLEGSPKQKK